jgi:hypothetical protein
MSRCFCGRTGIGGKLLITISFQSDSLCAGSPGRLPLCFFSHQINDTKRPGGAVSTSQFLSFLKLELIYRIPRVIKFSIQYASLGGLFLYPMRRNCNLTTKHDSSTLLRLQPYLDAGSQILLEEEIHIIDCALHSV